ncbi:hypothetical protein AB0E75_00270 [Streptomyces griseoviridis]|uniref:Uncharacterized protein n=3 Tax=Streptomyces TaxID=1883 RepID=A0A918G5R5_STRGD|nr:MULTISPECIES: hypothetical protein [Streptomyces]MDP9681462.1 hypothetical protein [Streptomyces griseoviridis]GGS20855.1 hypothetical protein GCM10010238_06380 [Streptomyces niveoruber]GGS74409.1 hypothetical protein GCM10010240_04320 [Streptomyces griseoviridis]GGU44631.1 hypothetical protein GCM10010259_39550 [Streptomyces daghestanicus]GHI34545.1 hypothetical protein Sdagh_62750 [Streptomyces daghestanicus]
MNDASTNQPMRADGADVRTAAGSGHGRHRGPVSSHDGERAPQGRHRKPSGESGTAAA